ncbi:MAG: Gfo/Idh/MocA family oxidoreductase [Candidatus Hydrogenedentota bacterium]
MTVKPIRVGVVGTGFGRYHMDGYSQLPGVEILAICDTNKQEAQQFADKYGAKYVFTSAKRMFSMDELDAVSIAVPNAQHMPMTLDALKKDKHVLIEKPMTIKPTDAKKMADAAKKAGKRLMVEQALRFRPEAQLVKAYAGRGEFGNMYYARSTWYRRKGWPHLHMPPDGTLGRGIWFLQKRRAGFGALGDIGVDLLDLAWYIMGTPKPVSVSGQLFRHVGVPELRAKGLPIEVEEMAAGLIKFQGGKAIMVEVSWDTYTKPAMECFIMGDRGGASVFPPKVFRGNDIDETVDIETHYNGLPIETAYSHFIDCIRDRRKKCIAPAEQNVTLIKMLDALARSNKSGKEVRL